tara:strand:+ start:125 stop:262 length:138 start_codon:yes stop_codon:yes gene_type:complete
MKIGIIGREPMITMQICRMIGERKAKAQRKAEFILRVKQSIQFWK